MSFDYHRYMASREWALKKEAVKERSGGMCTACIRSFGASCPGRLGQ